MKYIRPPEFKSVKEFTEYYRQVEQNITELLTKDSGTATSKAEYTAENRPASGGVVPVGCE